MFTVYETFTVNIYLVYLMFTPVYLLMFTHVYQKFTHVYQKFRQKKRHGWFLVYLLMFTDVYQKFTCLRKYLPE